MIYRHNIVEYAKSETSPVVVVPQWYDIEP